MNENSSPINFARYYDEITSLFRNEPLAHNTEFEILPALSVIYDLATNNFGADHFYSLNYS